MSELKDRRIWRVLVAHPSVTFVALQVIEFFINNYGLDQRLLTATIVAAVTTLPAAVLWNWRHGGVGRQEFRRGDVAAYTATFVLTVTCVGWYWGAAEAGPRAAPSSENAIRSIAVLPFEDGGDASIRYLGDGIAEGLTNWLASMPDVRVAAKTASFRLREQTSDLDALAAALDVTHVVVGKIARVGEQLVVSAELVDLADQRSVWGERLTQPAGGALTVERSIVSSLTGGLRLQVASTATESVGGTRVSEAYDEYLRGHYLIQGTDASTISLGLERLRAAIELDPKFARPYADIGDALSQMIYYGMVDAEELIGEARNAAYTAIALAPELPEAQVALAAVHQYVTFDWAEAEAAYESAIALSPLSPVPYHRYTDFLWATLRFDRAEQMAERALEIDPFDSNSMHALGIARLFGGDFPGAAEAFGDWNQFHPESLWSYVKHGVALAKAGQCDLSASQVDRAVQLTGGSPGLLMDTWIAWAYQACDDKASYAARKAHIDASSGDWGADYAAGWYMMALEGDVPGAVALVDRVVQSRSPFTLFTQILLVDHLGWPIAGAIREDARYIEIVTGLDFPASELAIARASN